MAPKRVASSQGKKACKKANTVNDLLGEEPMVSRESISKMLGFLKYTAGPAKAPQETKKGLAA